MTYQTYWFITTMRDQASAQWQRRRCWGFFDNMNDAEHAVLNNDGDIYEQEYEYAVIEEHYMGTIAMSTHNMRWYRWEPQSQKYEPISPPTWAHGVIHWGLG